MEWMIELDQLLRPTEIWRELIFLLATLLVLLIQHKRIRQRFLFVSVSLLLCELISRLYDVGQFSRWGWRTLDADGGLSYDFVSALINDSRWGIWLVVFYLVAPWCVAFLEPFRRRDDND